MIGSAAGNGFDVTLLDDDPVELYERAPCGYVSTLLDGTIVKVNETFLRWTGYEGRALVGHVKLHQLLAPGDRIFYETHYAPMLRMQGSVRELALDVVLATGERLPVLLNAVTKTDDAGVPILVRAVVVDARERRAYERELLEARRRAERSEQTARRLAAVLQSSFLPPSIPAIEHLDVAGAYRPAGDGSEVGGDFYDVFQTGPASWAAVLGDVCGKGAEAAVLTVLARHTLRAEAVRAATPSEGLSVLHQAMLRYHPDSYCTALFLAIEPEPAQACVRLAVGGHHLPLRLAADGRCLPVGEHGPILGMVPVPARQEHAVVLDAGEALVLFTDGVSEARNRDGFLGDTGVIDLLASLAGQPAKAIAEAVVDAAVSLQDGRPRDDIAVLVVRVPA